MKFFKTRTLYREGGSVQYLIRTTLFVCRWFSVKIHKALVSDTGPLHDHPWSYISFILKGGYFEVTLDKYGNEQRKWYGPGSVLIRKADVPHKLFIPEDKTCKSLIFTSYKWREWGFITPTGWVSRKKLKY